MTNEEHHASRVPVERVSLAPAFPGLKLTSCQEQAIRSLETFLNEGNDPVFLLKGYAGTGKTTLIRGLVAALGAAGRPFHLMAPTGRAARMIHRRSGCLASTIHRTIYRLDAVQGVTRIGGHESDEVRFVFDLAANHTVPGTVYIIDEASMVSDTRRTHEYLQFGSGRLLKDLLDYARPHDKLAGNRLIFVGDPAQLPPVDSAMSPALDSDYLTRICGLGVQESEMRTVVRQGEGGEILKNASMLRDALRTGVFGALDIRVGGEVVEISVGDLPRALIPGERKPDKDIVVIAHSNERVRDYNRMIRGRLFPKGDLLEIGDRLLVVANSYRLGSPIYNGDMAEVLEVDPLPLSPAKPVYVNMGKDEKGNVRNVFAPLVFRKVRLRLDPDEEGEGRQVETFVIQSLLDSAKGDLTPEEMKALFVDFRNRNPGLKPGSAPFKDALATDPWFNALRVKHGYAMTCHKAQGGEWNRVVVDFRCGLNPFTGAYFRWAYTALTRAREALLAIHPPHNAPDQPIRPGGVPLPMRPPVLEVELPSGASPGGQSGEAATAMVAAIHAAVKLRAESAGLVMAHLASKPWMEIVYLENDFRQRVVVRIMYNAARRIVKVEVSGDAPGPLRQKAGHVLGDLVERTLVIAGAVGKECEMAEAPLLEGPDWIRRFDGAVRATVAPAGVQLVEARGLTPYQYRYVFENDKGRAILLFYFNGRGVLTTCLPDPGGTTAPELANQLLALVNRQGGGV